MHLGSSPRMWGTPGRGKAGEAHRRFIPTHVGNTLVSHRSIMGFSVHPHACGEHHGESYGNWVLAGSSPRMWGTRLRPAHSRIAVRFIPTHVGNT